MIAMNGANGVDRIRQIVEQRLGQQKRLDMRMFRAAQPGENPRYVATPIMLLRVKGRVGPHIRPE
jgi:hypothetical protein